MANVKISDLPAASSAAGTDQLETNQSGTSRRLTVAQVATHVRSTATDTVVVAAGSASAPSIAPTGDSNTGIFFPAADTIAFSEGGVEALRLDSSGNATFAGTAAMSSSFLRNRIINGDMRIDQRRAGAALTPAANGDFIVDRFAFSATQASRFFGGQNYNSVTPPAGFTNYAGVQCSTSQSLAASDFFGILQRIEGFNTADLAWGSANAQSVTLTFRVYSSLTGTFGGSLQNSGGSRSYPFSYSVASANTWTTVSITVPGDTAGTWLTNNAQGIQVFFGLGVGSTFSGTAGSWAGSNLLAPTGAVSVVGTAFATFYLTGVQLEVGTAATPFERRLYGQELALCQRYFQSHPQPRARGVANSASSLNRVGFTLPTTMRAAPTGALTGTLEWYDGSVTGTITSLASGYATVGGFEFDAAPATGTTAQFRPIIIFVGGTGVINLSAEL